MSNKIKNQSPHESQRHIILSLAGSEVAIDCASLAGKIPGREKSVSPIGPNPDLQHQCKRRGKKGGGDHDHTG